MTTYDKLLTFIRYNVIKRGQFTLSSGETTDIYFDCKPLFLDFAAVSLLIPLVYSKLTNNNKFCFTALATIELGATPIITALLHYKHLIDKESLLTGIIVRKEKKEHGTKNLVEGNFISGSNLAILEDVITTGQSVKRAIETINMKAKIHPVSIVSIIDREEGGAELFKSMGIPFSSIVKKSELIKLFKIEVNANISNANREKANKKWARENNMNNKCLKCGIELICPDCAKLDTKNVA